MVGENFTFPLRSVSREMLGMLGMLELQKKLQRPTL